MTTVYARSTVAADGTVTVPVGVEDSGTEVEVTVTPVRGKMAKDMTQEEWADFVFRTAGSIDDLTFVRPEQPELRPAPEFD